MGLIHLLDADTGRKIDLAGSISAAGVLTLDTDATDAVASAHITSALTTGNHGQPKLNVVSGGNASSVLSGITASDTIVNGILVTVDADTGTGASGDKVTTMADIALTAGSGVVTYTGDKSGSLIIVSWIDRTA